jgi:succinoglycan biosynthesis transport protein ExoP
MTMQLSEPAATTVDATDVSPLRSAAALWGIVWRHKSFVLFGLMVGMIVGGLAFLQAAPVFQSSAQVLVIKKRPDVVMQNPADQRNVYTEDYLATHIIIIQSEEVLTRAARLLDVTALSNPPAGGNAVGLLRAGLTVTRDKDSTSGPTNIMTIAFRSAAPDDSRRLLKAVIDGYRDFLVETYGSTNDETLQLITKAQNVLQKELSQKQAAYQKICLRNPVAVKAKDGVGSFQDRIREVEGQVARRELRQKEIETRQKVIANGLKEGMSPATILSSLRDPNGGRASDNDPLRNLEGQLVDLRLRYEELTQTLGTAHPQALNLMKRIDIIREQLGRMKANDQGKPPPDPLDVVVQSLKSEYEENRLMLDSLQPLLKEERTKAEELARYLIEEEESRSEVVRLRLLCDGIIDRLRQINLSREAGGFDAKEITPPGPGTKVAPLVLVYSALALVGGLAAGMGLAYLADFNDRSFRSPVEIRQRLGLPVIGHIPHLASAAPTDPAELRQASAHLVAYHRPKSPEAEAFRGVRTALYFSTRGTGHQVIQITSPGMGDGKSTLVANLAVSIAQSGKRTVLIDADFRRPTAHKLFPTIGRETGLASVIAGDVPLEDAVQSTPVPNLWIMPCGPRPANPAELLTSQRFEELLADLRAKYDIVLVDTPPVLMVSDPCAVAPRVDGVLLVIRQAKNNRPGAERAVEVLASLGATVLGIMVNDKSINSREGYGYGGGYGYKYQYGYGYQPAYAETEDGAARKEFPALPAAPEPPANGIHSGNGQTPT